MPSVSESREKSANAVKTPAAQFLVLQIPVASKRLIIVSATKQAMIAAGRSLNLFKACRVGPIRSTDGGHHRKKGVVKVVKFATPLIASRHPNTTSAVNPTHIRAATIRHRFCRPEG